MVRLHVNEVPPAVPDRAAEPGREHVVAAPRASVDAMDGHAVQHLVRGEAAAWVRSEDSGLHVASREAARNLPDVRLDATHGRGIAGRHLENPEVVLRGRSAGIHRVQCGVRRYAAGVVMSVPDLRGSCGGVRARRIYDTRALSPSPGPGQTARTASG